MVPGMKSRPDALRSARERKGHTLTSLAPEVGLSKQRLWQLENDPEQQGLLPTTASRIAKALDVDIEDIATLTEEVAP